MTLSPSNNGCRLRALFWQEWARNALYFPLLNLLLETVLSDPLYALLSPTGTGLLAASLVQAGALVCWPERSVLGSLLGPGLFTVIGLSLYGWKFLSAPNHTAYWVFSLVTGLLRVGPGSHPGWQRALSNLLSALARGLTAATMYYLLHLRLDPTAALLMPDFLAEPGHRFAALALFALGLMSGWATERLPSAGVEETQPTRHRKPAAERAPAPAAPLPGLHRETRIVLVMNLRGLRAWSEAHQPEETLSLLHRYSQTATNTLKQHGVLAMRQRAGEVLAFFGDVENALQAALKLRLQINALVRRQGLNAALGLHSGTMLAGLPSEHAALHADEAGETIETARGIQAAAAPGELLVSEAVRLALGATFRAGPKRMLSLPERDDAVVVYPLE